MDCEQPVPVQEGWGWSRKRIKSPKATMSLGPDTVEVTSKLVVSSGDGFIRHPAGSGFGGYPRSLGKSSLVMPISTLYASPANMSRDLFCAFQPNRVMEPSLPLRLGTPAMPRNCLPAASAA